MTSLPSFRVRNLGPIERGTVRLHPLTILIGKNNTGKTYMAQAIYAAYKALERVNGPTTPRITTDEAEHLHDLLQTNTDVDSDLLEGSLSSKARHWISSRLERAGQALGDRLRVYFDLDHLHDLRRWNSTDQLHLSVNSDTPSPAFLFGIEETGPDDRLPIPRITARDLGNGPSPYSVQRILSLLSDDELEIGIHRRSIRRASSVLASSVWSNGFLPLVGLSGSAYYLPAGRSGLLEAWTDVVRLRLQQDRDRLALTSRDAPALGGIALDFLSQLQDLINPRRIRRMVYPGRYPGTNEAEKDLDSAAGYLEDLIRGEVGFARGKESIPSLTYTDGEYSIPVQRASSMVAELAPLLSWIREVLAPGDLVIIDEPEAHMHPEAVLAVAQTLVALSRSGVRVLCTTHSSEFLHQVSNCMLRSKSRDGESHDGSMSIDADDIGVYRFLRPDRDLGSRVIQENIDPEWGIPEEEHIAVAERLSEETAKLVDVTGLLPVPVP